MLLKIQRINMQEWFAATEDKVDWPLYFQVKELDKSELVKFEELIIMWEELGVSGGTAIIVLITLYFVIKWAVKNGIKEAYRDITGKKTDEDVKNEKELKELGFDLEDK